MLDELFRSFHSIKGISGMVELRDAEMLAHHMESYLRALRQREAQLTAAGMDALIPRRRRARADDRRAPRRGDRPLDRPGRPPAGRGRPAPGVRGGRGRRGSPASPPELPATASWRVTFVPSPALIARGVNVDSVRARLREAGTIVDATPKVTPDGIAFEFLLAGELDEAGIAQWEADGMRAEPVAAVDPAPLAEPRAGDAARAWPRRTSSASIWRGSTR